MMTPIHPIAPIAQDKQVRQSTPVSGGDSGLFQSVLESAIDNVRQTEADAVQAQTLMATGQLDNPAALTIAQTKSAIAVDLLVQLRNKTLDAYSELTRINL